MGFLQLVLLAAFASWTITWSVLVFRGLSRLEKYSETEIAKLRKRVGDLEYAQEHKDQGEP